MFRKTILILSLSLTLALTVVVLALQDDLRDRLGDNYWTISLALTGSVLVVLSGYVWDRNFAYRLRSLRASAATADKEGDDSSDPDEIIGLARKIERMAKKLQSVEASYREIVEDQTDLICRYRPDGRITFVNGAYERAFRMNRTELVGTQFPYRSRESTEAGSVTSFKRELCVTTEQPVWIEWRQKEILDASGSVVEYQAVGHDVTAQEEAEAALRSARRVAEQADKAKTEFLTMVTHELRTPINGVIGFTRLLADSPLTSAQREHVSMIQTSGLTLEKLIGDILDLSKIDAGKLEIEQKPFSPQECAEDACAFFAAQARSASIKLEFRVDPGLPPVVNGDESRVRQILTNLIGNALKFTERGTVALQLSCSRSDPIEGGSMRTARLYFAVSDTGVGIQHERLSQLFQPYGQVDNSAKKRREGTGLGLIISKKLCELMGGTISVESTPGEGSTFRFSVLTYFSGEEPLTLPSALPSPVHT